MKCRAFIYRAAKFIWRFVRVIQKLYVFPARFELQTFFCTFTVQFLMFLYTSNRSINYDFDSDGSPF